MCEGECEALTGVLDECDEWEAVPDVLMGAGMVRLDRTDETDDCRAWDGSPVEDEMRDGLPVPAAAATGDTGRDLLALAALVS